MILGILSYTCLKMKSGSNHLCPRLLDLSNLHEQEVRVPQISDVRRESANTWRRGGSARHEATTRLIQLGTPILACGFTIL